MNCYSDSDESVAVSKKDAKMFPISSLYLSPRVTL
jgi:hypothetical protein